MKRYTTCAFLVSWGLFCLGVNAVSACGEARCTSVLAAEDEYQVGDRVRFEFLGDVVQGTVVGINGNGWLWIEFEARGGQRRKLLPPMKVIAKIDLPTGGQSEQAAGTDNMQGQSDEKAESSGSADDYRVWTDNRGKTIEARLVEMKNNKLKFQKKDGSTIEVRISDLRPRDIQAAMTWNSERQFGDRKGKRQPQKDEGPEGPEAAGYQTVVFDFSDIREIKQEAAGWDLKRAAAWPASEGPKQQRFSMALQASHTGGLLRDPRVPSRAFLVATNVLDPPTGFLFDDQAGRTIGPIDIPTPKSRVLAYDAVRHRLLTSSGWSRRNRTLDVWKLTPDGIQHQYSFSPYPPGKKVQLTPSTASFLNNDRLAVVMFNRISFFDLNERKALGGLEFDFGTFPSFGQLREFAFGLKGQHVVAVDLQSMKIVARSPVLLKTPDRKLRQPPPQFSISPDLSRVVTLRRRFLEVYNLRDGERVNRFLLPTVRELQPVFLDQENILAINNMGGSLISVPLKSAIWNYSFCKFSLGSPGDGRNWLLSKDVEGSQAGWSGRFDVTAKSLPNRKAQEIMQSLELEDLIVLRPGDTVALQLSAAGAGQAIIREQLLSLGYKIDANSPNVLKASVTDGKTENRQYQNLGGGGGSQSATFSSQYFQLELRQRNQTVWFIQGGSSSKELGDFVVLYEGDTVQSLANEGRINASQFFSSIVVPDLFVKVPEKGFYGFSKGNEAGFADD